jgi:hypothetical protein
VFGATSASCLDSEGQLYRGHGGHDRMVVGFTINYASSAYHHWCCEFESRSGRGVQHYVIKFISDLRQVDGFLRVFRFPPSSKTDRHDITEILLKVAINTIKKTYIYMCVCYICFSEGRQTRGLPRGSHSLEI